MYLKIHTSGKNTVVAICDKDVLGMKLKEGNLTVTIEESFFRGEIVDDLTIKKVVSEANNVNLFGKKSVQCAIECGAINPEGVIYIQGVPHAQIFVI